MRRTRFGVLGLAVAVLALVGTACQPAPKQQMELSVRLNPTGYVDILSNRITLSVSVSCTRKTLVAVTPWAYLGSDAVQLERADAVRAIGCDGPQIGNWIPTKWRIPDPYPPAPPEDLVVLVEARTVTWNDALPPPLIDQASARAIGTVTLNPILCWPGFPTCSPA